MDFQSLVLFCFFFPVPATSLLFPLHSHWHSSDGYQTMSSRRHIPLLCCHSAHPQTHLPSNQWPCSTAGTHKQNRYKPLVNNQTNSWALMRMKKKKPMTYSISQTHCRFLHICVDQYRWKSNRVAPAVHLLPGVSVVVLLSSCACWRPSRYTAMPSYMGIHLWDRSELCCLCRHGEEEGARIRESSQPAAPSSASPCVSRSPGSFQPAPQQPQSQGANAGGWEVLRGLKRTWNSEQSTSSSYMSDCSQWTCCSWSLCPVPVCFQCMWVCAFLCICASVPAPVCAVCGGKKRVCLLPHC